MQAIKSSGAETKFGLSDQTETFKLAARSIADKNCTTSCAVVWVTSTQIVALFSFACKT